jgi:hypothetical protein
MKWLYPEGSVCSTPGCGRPPNALGMCRKCHAAWKWATPRLERIAFKAWWMRTRPVKTKKQKQAENTIYVRALRARRRAEKAAGLPSGLSPEGPKTMSGFFPEAGHELGHAPRKFLHKDIRGLETK